MIVVDPEKVAKLAKASLFGGDAHRHLHVDHFVFPGAHEVDLAVAQHPDAYGPAILKELEIDRILKDFPEVGLSESTEGAAQAEVLEVELLADLEEPLALDVVAMATMYQECGFDASTR